MKRFFTFCGKTYLVPSAVGLIVSAAIIFGSTFILYSLLPIGYNMLSAVFLAITAYIAFKYFRLMNANDYHDISSQIKRFMEKDGVFNESEIEEIDETKPFLIHYSEKDGRYSVTNIGNIYQEGSFAQTYMLLLCYGLYLEYKENHEDCELNQLTDQLDCIIERLNTRRNFKADLKFFVRMFMRNKHFDISSLIQNKGKSYETPDITPKDVQ